MEVSRVIDFNNPSEHPKFNQLQQFMLMGLQAKRFLDLGAPGLSDEEKDVVYELFEHLN